MVEIRKPSVKKIERAHILIPEDIKKALNFLIKNAPFPSCYVFAK